VNDKEWIEEWLSDEEWDFLFDFLGGQVQPSERKMRLFACACCRAVWTFITDTKCREAIKVAEQFADHHVSVESLRVIYAEVAELARITWENTHRGGTISLEVALARSLAGAAVHVSKEKVEEFFGKDAVDAVIGLVIHSAIPAHLWGTREGDDAAEEALAPANAKFLHRFRCIFGNPFQPTPIDPGWLTPTVLSLSQAVYAERHLPSGHLDSARIAILADALEDAGCTDPTILSHLRGPGPHVRGCWLLDRLLGKS
jgi:hypothetical protein